MQSGTQSNRAPGPPCAVLACTIIQPSAATSAGPRPASAAEIPVLPRSPALRRSAAHRALLRRAPYRKPLRAAHDLPAPRREHLLEQSDKLSARRSVVSDPPQIQNLDPA